MIGVSDISNLGYILTIETSAALNSTVQHIEKIKNSFVMEHLRHIVDYDLQVILSINYIVKSIFADMVLNFRFKYKQRLLRRAKYLRQVFTYVKHTVI